ncbi:hypothetical protein EV426DRAFT_703798 [Tirmania nivea]|nr:hypothetical protein EV426DRAFT_703798 [Tirmania nivea]
MYVRITNRALHRLIFLPPNLRSVQNPPRQHYGCPPPEHIYPVQGVKTGGVCPRMEIDDFMQDKNAKQRDLFLETMKIMAARPKDDPLSFYQLAGLHGFPADKTWPVDGGPHATTPPGAIILAHC